MLGEALRTVVTAHDGLPMHGPGRPKDLVEFARSLVPGFTTLGDAAALLEQERAAEMLAGVPGVGGAYKTLRPLTARGELHVRYPAVVAALGAGNVAEAAAVPAASTLFERRLMDGQKAAALTIISDELARHSHAGSFLEQRLAVDVEAATDREFVGQLQVAISDVPASGPDARDVARDLRRLLALVPSGTDAAPVLLVPIEVEKRLMAMTDDSGRLAFPGLGPGGGHIGAIVVASTGALANDAVLVDASALLTADEGLEVSTSRHGSVEMASVPAGKSNDHASPPAPVESSATSLFQSGAIALRATRRWDWLPIRYPFAARLKDVAGAWAMHGSPPTL